MPRRAERRPPPGGSTIVLLNKPYGVLCQFRPSGARATLKDFIHAPDLYPVGRLDADSEGLLVLTNDGAISHALAHPSGGARKTYWAQVEGLPGADALATLAAGVEIAGRVTRPARVRLMDPPERLWDRDPPIRFRRQVPTRWVELVLTEGRNRQVRRMTAAVGHPTLRLIRVRVGPYRLGALAPGESREAPPPPASGRRTGKMGTC